MLHVAQSVPLGRPRSTNSYPPAISSMKTTRSTSDILYRTDLFPVRLTLIVCAHAVCAPAARSSKAAIMLLYFIAVCFISLLLLPHGADAVAAVAGIVGFHNGTKVLHGRVTY